MASSTISFLSLLTLSLFFLTVGGRTFIRKCPNRTPVCSHGQCLKRINYDEGNMVVETECICDPDYYGKACTIFIKTEWDKAEIVSPMDTSYFSWADFDEDYADEFGKYK